MSNNTNLKSTPSPWESATGEIRYPLTNDYMFRIVLENNITILKGIISATMHIPICDIDTAVVKNPIVLGASISDKTYILDVKVILNNSQIINMEMQITNLHNWTNRSLSYLCRNFDKLQHGQDYNSASSVTHIGFLDYDLFPDCKSFFSTYHLIDQVTGKHFNDNFTLKVLSLNRIDLISDEDKEWHLDEWALLFKARTWEDIKMLAIKNDIYASAADSIFQYNADELVREQCQAREDLIRHEERMQHELSKAQRQLAEAQRELAEAQRELAEALQSKVELQKELDSVKSTLKDTKSN